MSASGSVSEWLSRVPEGDREAVRRLWQRYYPRLVALARQRLCAAGTRPSDAEDVALSAFDSFCRGAEQGRFPNLLDRDGLWALLVVITVRKAANLVRDEDRDRRGGGRVRAFSDLLEAAAGGGPDLPSLLAREPDPHFAAEAAEAYRRLLAALGDPTLRAVAVWKMEGYTNEEIAAKMGRSVPTVERKLRLIRKLWEDEGRP